MKRVFVALLLFTLLISMLTATIPVSAQEDGYFHTHTCYMVLGHWVWTEVEYPPVGDKPPFVKKFWSGPGSDKAECYGAIDLRSLPEMEPGEYDGQLGGLSFFFSSGPISQQGSYLLSTNGFDVNMPPQAMNLLERTYAININAYTVNGTIWDVFVNHGDLTGMTRWKPIQQKADGTIEIQVNGFSLVVFAKDPPKCFPKPLPKLLPKLPPLPPKHPFFKPWFPPFRPFGSGRR